jgi:hypothetical protein
MGFSTYYKFVSAYNDGQSRFAAFRKTPNAAFVTVAGTWSDLSGTPGQPKPNYYAATPITPTLLDGLDGIYHGQNVSPATKHLHRFGLYSPTANVVPSQWYLCDYLMFYPFIDMDAAGETQAMIIPAIPVSLPRYADGIGVKMMLVAQAPYTGGQTFDITYIDSADATQTLTGVGTNTATIIGSIVNSGSALAGVYGPFLPDKGTGVKSVVSVTFNGANGGLAALVLVKPLFGTYLREITAVSEDESTTTKAGMPRIYDGAYLNLIGSCVTGSFASSTIGGYAEFVWGN